MQSVVQSGTGRRALAVGRPVAGKTGTTDDYHDAWFVGYSTSVVVGVWVGFDQPAPIGREAYGARVALPIWADFMRRTSKQLTLRATRCTWALFTAAVRGRVAAAICF